MWLRPNLRLTPGRALGQPAPPGPRVAPPAAWRLHPRGCVGTRNRAAWHRVGRPTTAASAPAPAAPRARRRRDRPGARLCGAPLGCTGGR
jgi:hypothetical protein